MTCRPESCCRTAEQKRGWESGAKAWSLRGVFRFLLVLYCAIGFGRAWADHNHEVESKLGSEFQHVLILNSHSVGIPWASMMHDAIREALSVPEGANIRLHIEYTGLMQNTSPEYAQSLLQFYRQKYRDVPLAVIQTLDVAATRWMMNTGVEEFPTIPTIYSIDEGRLLLEPRTPQMLGVLAEFDIERNIASALTLHPNTQQIAIIGGVDPMGEAFGSRMLQAVEDYGGSHQVIDLIGLPMAEIFSRVSHLPDHSIIFYLPVLVDGAGEHFVPRRILSRISEIANAPIYGLWDTLVGFGIVGGYVSDTRITGRALGGVILDVLSGKSFDEIGVYPRFSSFQYDWEQVQRWNINPNLLPPGSLIVNREPTLWEQYAWQISLTFLLMAILALMVVGLVLRGVHRPGSLQADQRSPRTRCGGSVVDSARPADARGVARCRHAGASGGR